MGKAKRILENLAPISMCSQTELGTVAPGLRVSSLDTTKPPLQAP